MPGRVTSLITNGYYHVYNRGSDLRNVFTQDRDYQRFKKTIHYYQFLGPKPSFSKFAKSDLSRFEPDPAKKLVEILCFCLMPNHIHFLIHQLVDGGISSYMSQISNSHTKYFNTKYPRVGALFQGAFRVVPIETDEQLLHVSRYIHLNPVVAGIVKSPLDYRWSSYCEYMFGGSVCSPDMVLGQFSSIAKYDQFVKDQIDYGITLELIKHQLLDLEG